MIDLVKKFDQHEKSISGHISGIISDYFGSKCYEILDKRITELQNSNDLKPASTRKNTFISGVVFPIVKERALLRRAITAGNYRSADIFNLTAIGSTPPENAAQSELVLNINLEHTHYKMKCLKPCIDTASKFGTSITYTYWKVDSNEKLKTVYDPMTGTYSRVRSSDTRKNSYNIQIGLRDYFQNPNTPEPEESDFQGHYKKVYLHELVNLLDDDTYIRENVAKVIDLLKNGNVPRKGGANDYSNFNEKSGCADLARFEGLISIKGNEDGTQRYFVEMIGDTIIKLSVDDYDDDMRSYTVCSFDKRNEYWWGNSDSEYVVSHENFMNTFLSMTADNALSSMRQYIFFGKDTIDPSDISASHRRNGFVPVDVKNYAVNNMVQPFQPGALNLNPAQFITQMVNDSIQKMSTKVDLSRNTNQGGGIQNNSTATAANIIANQASLLESDILENYDFGVQMIGMKNVILLQMFLSELFWVRPKPTDIERMVHKYQILGEYGYKTNTTASKNQQAELLRLQNLATWLLNIMVNPAMQQAGYNVAPIVKDILQKADVPSVEDILPNEQVMQAAPGYMQSSQDPMAMTGGGMQPMMQGAGNAVMA